MLRWPSSVVYRNDFGYAGGPLAAFDLNLDAIGCAQAIRRHIVRRDDGNAATQARPGGHRCKVAHAVGSIIQSTLQSLDLHDGANEARRQPQREQPVGNGASPGELAFGAFDIDVNPLIVSRGFGIPLDALLGNLDPVADADLRSDRGLEVFEIPEFE